MKARYVSQDVRPDREAGNVNFVLHVWRWLRDYSRELGGPDQGYAEQVVRSYGNRKDDSAAMFAVEVAQRYLAVFGGEK